MSRRTCKIEGSSKQDNGDTNGRNPEKSDKVGKNEDDRIVTLTWIHPRGKSDNLSWTSNISSSFNVWHWTSVQQKLGDMTKWLGWQKTCNYKENGSILPSNNVLSRDQYPSVIIQHQIKLPMGNCKNNYLVTGRCFCNW